MKRLFDLTLSIVLLVLTLPLMLIATIGIKLSSPGPVFYTSWRVGKDAKDFEIYKFRTMTVNTGSGAAVTRPDDDRIFSFGKFLRSTKIDELPQLANILIGQMSFVGPRPEDPYFVREHYTPLMLKTLETRPGLTSPGTLAYMRGFRQNENVEDFQQYYITTLLPEKVLCDLEYMQSGTFFSDMRLILQTALLIARKLLLLNAKE